jgi:probable rRNA maturation factor
MEAAPKTYLRKGRRENIKAAVYLLRREDMEIIIANHQRLFKIDRRKTKIMLNSMLEYLSDGLKNDVLRTELSILFVNDKLIREMNRSYRGKDKTTDVLSFPQMSFNNSGNETVVMATEQPPLLGDIVINTYQAARQAEEYGVSLQSEIIRLLTHGFLHLLGYDHEKCIEDARCMRALERRIVRKLAILS